MRQIDHGSITLYRSVVLESVMHELRGNAEVVIGVLASLYRVALLFMFATKREEPIWAGRQRGGGAGKGMGGGVGMMATMQAGSKNCDWFVYLYNSSQAQLETHTHTGTHVRTHVCVVKIYTICCGFGLVALFGFGALALFTLLI